MCHGLCELGSTDFLASMTSVRLWLDSHPEETLTIVIEDHVAADRIGAGLAESGLASYAYEPQSGQAWPTLHEMITTGKRLVVMLEAGRGGASYPWLVNGFSSILQETAYTFQSPSDFSCAPNRGPTTATLFQVNHWLAGFSSLVTDAESVNSFGVLGPRVQRCWDERQRPNFIAVNYADIGDLQDVVRRLNGVS